MPEGIIIKALSGFYYVDTGGGIVECRARGKFRREGLSPLVGDRVAVVLDSSGKGTVSEVQERRNSFIRPAVANVDLLVMIASASIPVTDPYLIDRVASIAEHAGCDVVICLNKSDIDTGDELFDIYSKAGFTTIRTSAVTGEGIDELRRVIKGKTSAFTGNSGVGKSSILNALEPGAAIQTGEVSEKLGRGRHTTRHVELFSIGDGTFIADTPGFASFDTERVELIKKEELQYTFRDFLPYIGKCRFDDCAHIKEPGCAVLDAVGSGDIGKTRHDSYVRLYDIASKIREWEIK